MGKRAAIIGIFVGSVISCFGQIELSLAGLRAPAAAPTYLINQNFEGAGYDNGETWSETGVCDEDTDTTGLDMIGSQCLTVDGSADNRLATSPSVNPGTTNVWFYFKYRPSDIPLGDRRLFILRSNTVDIASVRIRNTGPGYVRIYHGTAFTATTGTMSADTSYHVFGYYQVSVTGTDGFAWVAFSTDGSIPTSGNPNYAEVTTGTSTTLGTQVNVRCQSEYTSGSGIVAYFDRVLLDNEAISASP